MILRLLVRIFRRTVGPTREATALVSRYGAETALVIAGDKHRLARVVDSGDDTRYWKRVMSEIERQSGIGAGADLS